MGKPLYTLHTFKPVDTGNGLLTMYQEQPEHGVPFPIKKVLVIKDMKGDDARGGHAHHQAKQILLCISGACTIDVDDGTEKAEVRLEANGTGILFYPYVWHVMRDFAPGTILLVLADTEYDEREYIRDYQEFLSYVRA